MKLVLDFLIFVSELVMLVCAIARRDCGQTRLLSRQRGCLGALS